MKKFFTTIIAITFFFSVYSEPVNKEEAKQIAEKYFNSYAPSAKAGSSINKIITEYYQGNESFYIFGFNEGGFVIVSADDNAKPILGYSFINPIKEEIGSNTRYLFDRYKKEISFLKESKKSNEVINSLWEDLRSGNLKNDIKAAGPLLTTVWDQSPYYNEYCPTGTPTGCVATAMSQIMNYHNWPASGNGWHKYIPEDHPEYDTQYADFSSEVYDWANMPSELNGSSSSTEVDAVAMLNYHAGVSVNMNYDPEGSGAMSRDVMYAMTSYFKYDPTTIEYIVYDSNDETPYLNKLKSEIDNNQPIYYSGQGSAGGHAWVCDGYDDSDKVHINWGWGGSYNGYFLLSNMVAGSYDFTDSNSMIIGIQPGSAVQDILWTKQASGFEAASRGIQYLSVIDKRSAWAVAYDGSGTGGDVNEFTRTTDGNNWSSGTINATGTNGLSAAMISAIDENTAWVALFDGSNGGGKIVKTSDGGLNWTHQSTAAFTAPNGFPNVVHFWDKNNGFCQGDPNDGYFEFYTTTDGGTTWTRVPDGNIPANQSEEYGTVGYYTTYGNIIWFATNKGRIFKSTDKGYNWVAYQTPLSEASFELSFKDANTGIIQRRGSGDNNIQYITTNGGENWTELNPIGNFYTNSFKYVPGENLLISTGSDYETPFQGVSFSTDDGTTFTDYAEFYQNFQFLAIGAASADAIWAGGYNADENNDGMWHLGDILISTEIDADKYSSCTSEDIVFTDITYGTPDTWAWNFGDGANPASASGIGPHTVSYTTSGLKDITLTINKGTDEQIYMKEEFINVLSSIPNDISSITGNTSVIAGEKHIYSVPNQDNVLFNWDFTSDWTGSSITNEIEIEFTGASGTSSIIVTPTNACGDGASASVEIQVGSSVGFSNIKNESISIYPNPAKEYINISGVEISDIYIYDSAGNLVKIYKKSGSNSHIEISDLNSGIYQLSIISKDKIYTKSISIIK